MDRGAWKATVHNVAELDTTEVTARTPCSQESFAGFNALLLPS